MHDAGSVAELDRQNARDDQLPENSYALAKGLSEEIARQMSRWNPSTSLVGLRISNIIAPNEYAMFASWQSDANIRRWNLWS